ncbi:MAG: His/Gly/Thr/Pro-type tRNA ligase C-terminal domain-containing protein, partial [Candidatus Gottesmanbacteria bacterium]|nr:His/Gly/Thr/Pro-type tRNA ligase C-terminal domain-containing protein [Candidatus Gottesmanbacteria bacterium]
SETIMYAMYAKWVHSWRDLPILINQWNNMVRWEKRTYLFLRTTEFLWQEGHTAHETEKEAVDMALSAFEWYRQVFEDYLAIPVYQGIKSESEKFAGAKTTYTNEALMPDGKALQSATSHNLGQNFSKVFDIQFATRDGQTDYVWQTSWGLSTRTLGGLFLIHGDDSGIILPPKIAPIQIIIMPIRKKDADAKILLAKCEELRETLINSGIRVKVDTREEPSVGRRFNEWEVKGVPVRLEIGGRELEADTVVIARRDTGEKMTVPRKEIVTTVQKLSNDIQKSLFTNAKKFRDDNTRDAKSYDEFKKIMDTTRGFPRVYPCILV